MKLTYGLAEYDRYTGSVDFNIHLPMDGVTGGNFYEFLATAGERGWELCGCFPSSRKGGRRALPGASEARVSDDAAEQIALVFIKR